MRLNGNTGKIEKYGSTYFFTIKSSDGLKTEWNVKNCENPKKELRDGLVQCWGYTEKYKLMKTFYRGDYEEARRQAQMSTKYGEIEAEKMNLLNKII